MSNCCGSKVDKKRHQKGRGSKQGPGSNNWLNKIKIALGLSQKAVLSDKKNVVHQQNHQKSSCC